MFVFIEWFYILLVSVLNYFNVCHLMPGWSNLDVLSTERPPKGVVPFWSALSVVCWSPGPASDCSPDAPVWTSTQWVATPGPLQTACLISASWFLLCFCHRLQHGIRRNDTALSLSALRGILHLWVEVSSRGKLERNVHFFYSSNSRGMK